MIRFRSILNGDIRTKWRRESFDAGYGSFVPFSPLLANVSPAIQANFLDLTPYTAPVWLDNSGTTGNRMYYDSTGVLTWAPANLIPTSATLTTQTITNAITAGGDYMLSAEVAAGASVAVTGGATATLNTSSSSVGSRYYVKLSALSTGSLTLTVTGAVTNAQLERITYQTTPRTLIATTGAQKFLPRFDSYYDTTDSTWKAKGLLIEESRQNLATYSEQLNNSNWTLGFSGLLAFGSGSIANDTVAPDGTTTADKIVENTAASAQHRFFNNSAFTVTNGASVAYSIFVKAAGRTSVRLTDNALQGATFDLTTGAVSLVSVGVTATAVPAGNNWWRIGITKTSGSASGRIAIYFVKDGATTYTGDGVSGIYAWGAQVENSSPSVSSYISTVAASVTRSADIISLSGAALTAAGAATGSAIVQTSAWLDASIVRDLLSTSTSRRLLYSNSSNTAISTTNGTTALSATLGSAGTFTGGSARTGIAWGALGRSIVGNNGVLIADAVVLGSGATVNLGGYASTTTFVGWVASMALYDQKLPNVLLKQKSSVGATY